MLINVAGLLITGGSSNGEFLTTAEVYDVSTGGSCEVSQLPDMRFYHTQVIFDNIVSIYIYHFIRMETWPVVELLLLKLVYN